MEPGFAGHQLTFEGFLPCRRACIKPAPGGQILPIEDNHRVAEALCSEV